MYFSSPFHQFFSFSVTQGMTFSVNSLMPRFLIAVNTGDDSDLSMSCVAEAARLSTFSLAVEITSTLPTAVTFAWVSSLAMTSCRATVTPKNPPESLLCPSPLSAMVFACRSPSADTFTSPPASSVPSTTALALFTSTATATATGT